MKQKMPYLCGLWRFANAYRSFNKGEEILTVSQINEIAERITSNHKEQRAICKVNCEEIIEDYALLMATIEEAAGGTYSSVEEIKNIEQEVDEEVMDKEIKIMEFLTKESVVKDQKILNMVGGAAGLLVAFGLGIVTKSIVSRR